MCYVEQGRGGDSGASKGRLDCVCVCVGGTGCNISLVSPRGICRKGKS